MTPKQLREEANGPWVTDDVMWDEAAPDGVPWGADCFHSPHLLINNVTQPCDDPDCVHRPSPR